MTHFSAQHFDKDFKSICGIPKRRFWRAKWIIFASSINISNRFSDRILWCSKNEWSKKLKREKNTTMLSCRSTKTCHDNYFRYVTFWKDIIWALCHNIKTSVHYRRQRSWGKVMLLHVSLILFTGGHSYPSMPCRSLGGSPGPHPGGSWGVWPGGLQAHTLGVSRPTPGGLCIPVCTEATSPPWIATAEGGTHPTGMHSCLLVKFLFEMCPVGLNRNKNVQKD